MKPDPLARKAAAGHNRAMRPATSEVPPDPEIAALYARVAALVDSGDAPGDSGGDQFAELAPAVFRLQCRRIPAWQRFCAGRGVDPETVADWRAIPALPIFAFRSLELALAPPRETFRSSGTTGGEAERSVHRHPFPDLYRRVIDATCAPAVFGERWNGGEPPRRPILSLVPRREDVGDSSLGFWAAHILERHGAEGGGTQGSAVAMTPQGVDAAAADAFTARAAKAGEPVTVLATAFALADWLERGDPATLPPGSTLVETGGFKGRRREISRAELLALVEEKLGLAERQVVREYGMSELTAHFYTEVLRGGDPDLFVPPPFARVRALDPETLEEAAPGQTGLLAVFDLANLGSVCHVLTQDLGVAEGKGFRLLGRAQGAALRGCSLTAEELALARG